MTAARKTYDILDEGMRFVGAHRIKRGQKTIEVTEDEAKFFLENGGLQEAKAEAPKGKAAPAKAD